MKDVMKPQELKEPKPVKKEAQKKEEGEKQKRKEKFKMNLPFIYNGKRGEHLLLWITEIQMYCGTTPVAEDSQVAFSTSCLGEVPKEWVMSKANAAGFEDIREWAETMTLWEFLQKIMEQFLDKTTTNKVFDELTTINQKRWSTVDALSREVDRLLQVPALNLQDNQVLYINSRALPELIRGQLVAKAKSGKYNYRQFRDLALQREQMTTRVKGTYAAVVKGGQTNYLGALIYEFGLSEDMTRSLGEAYKEDAITMDIINKLQAKDKATTDEFVMVDGLLFLEKAGFKRLVVPFREVLRSLFLGECHNATGHFGYKKTSANLVQRFWWPNILDDAKKYVQTCQVCQRDKPRTRAPLGLLKPLPIPAGPGQSISMHFMDTLVTSKNGKRHIFVIVDRFTKYARRIAMSETASTEHVIKLFMDNWVRDFGLPKIIVSDRDVRFTSAMWKKAAEQMRSQLQMTSRNHPEANGQVEQMNRVVQHLLRHYIKPSQDDWDEKLPLIASLYNNVVHITTGVSPNQLHLGWKPRSSLDFLLPENRTIATPGTIEFGVHYAKLLQQTVEHIKKSQEAMIASENKHRRQSTFQVGERV
ncbi:hypothetical protein CBR_g48407 [Chara braunii]|uniref:Integrase catalytic domain-containing protein n=1 Tax=Chara braunii TaxID=69332 RepID=A0A388M2L1_CHABU|nr:hypothetical protein CBR_g48407 [Chara braunii]|eukprot:GBG88791.1 hypothetical protein CBR_g48407 [Chara braunii]